MKVYVVGIGEHELHQSQRIVFRRRLPHRKGKGFRSIRCKVDRLSRHDPAVAVDNVQLRGCVRIALQKRQIFFGRDGSGHVPGWIDHHELYYIRKLWRAAIRHVLANYRPRRKSYLAMVNDLGAEIRQVDPDIAVTPVNVHPAFTLHRDQHRFQAVFGADIQFSNRRFACNSRGFQPGINLKFLNSPLNGRVISLRRSLLQISQQYQTVTQLYHCVTGRPRLQRRRINNLPPPPVRDPGLKIDFFFHQQRISRSFRRERP